MAERKYFAIVTDVGQSKIAEAAAGGKKLNVTTFIAGDGNGQYYIPTSDMTEIKHEVWRGSISKTEIVQDAQKILRVTTIIPAKVNGFIVRELGLLDETGELIAIGNSPDLPKVSLENGFSIDMQLTMRLAVKNAETFSFEIDPNTVILTKDMLNTHNADGNAHEELFEGKADKQHQHSTDDIISGTLPIERGGTGADTPSNALSNLGGFSNKGGYINGNVNVRGSVEIDNTSDIFYVSTTSGDISLGTTSGDISLGTTSGNILLSTTSGNVQIPKLNLSAITSNTTLPIANGGTGNTTGLAASATKLQTARTIDGMPFDGSANVVHFGICNTAAATAEKTVSLTGFVLTEGARIAVYFANANTASHPSLNINGTGAYFLAYRNGNWAKNGHWEAGDIIEFVYYNNHWIMLTANAHILTTPRAIQTNLGSTSSANFDGSGNITPGVTGTLPIANGGTGATSASTALSNLGGFAKTGGTISGATTIQGNLTLKTASSNYGCKINFGDGDYVHLYEITDDKLEIKASNIDFVVSGNITKNGAAFGSVTKEQIETAVSKDNTGTIAIGIRALNAMPAKNSTYNIAIGVDAMGVSHDCHHNVAIGTNAGYNIRDGGNWNTAIGINALHSNTTGSDNTAIGENALYNLTSYGKCTGLGYNAQVTGSNQVQLGDTNVTVYAQKALVVRSDARDKLDIEDSPLGLNFIMKLRPRKYRMNSREAYFEQDKERDFTATNDGSKAGKRPHYGLVAQEVKEAMNELNVDFAGYLDSKVDGGEDVLSLGYAEFIAPMIKAIQQQQQMIEQLQKEIEILKS